MRREVEERLREDPEEDHRGAEQNGDDEDRKMCKLLQDHRAMMDWIAVPNFLG